MKAEAALKQFGGSEWAWYWKFNGTKTDHLLFVYHIPTGRMKRIGKVK